MFRLSPTFVILIVLLTFGRIEFTTAQLKDPFRLLEPGYRFFPIFYKPGIVLSDQGQVFGARSCGGDTEVHEIRYDVCITGFPDLCALETHRVGHLELVIIPKKTFNGIYVSPGVTMDDGEIFTWDIPMANQSLIAGQAYLVTGDFTTNPELLGKTFTWWTRITDMVDRKLVVCTQGVLYAH